MKRRTGLRAAALALAALMAAAAGCASAALCAFGALCALCAFCAFCAVAFPSMPFTVLSVEVFIAWNPPTASRSPLPFRGGSYISYDILQPKNRKSTIMP